MQQTVPSQRRPDDAAPITLTIPAAVRATGLSRATLYRHSAAGRLPFHRVGGRTLIKVADIHRLIDGAAA